MNSQVINTFLKKNTLTISIIFIFILTRLLLSNQDIKPDPKFISLMQHIDLKLLEEDLLGSLFFFHSQPPVWNFIIGIGVKLLGTETNNIVTYIHYLNLFFTLCVIFFCIKTLNLLSIKKSVIFFSLSFLIIFSPSIIFYENFLSYSHFTCLNIFIIKYYFIKLFKKYKLRYLVKIYFFSSLLSLTWSAYTFLFFFIIFFLIFLKDNLSVKKNSFLIFLIFLLIGNLPAIKNKIYFNFLTNSTWTGINASQALGYDRVEWPKCSFQLEDVKKNNYLFRLENKNKKYLNHPLLNNNRFNDLGFLHKSKYCSTKIKGHLIKNLEPLFIEKFSRFLSVHGHLSFDYAFKPIGWVKKFSYLEYLNNNEFFKIFVFIFFMTIYFCLFIFFIKAIFKKKKEIMDYLIIINIFLYAYLMLISFVGSSWEQERMRYTEYSFIFYSIIIIMRKFKFF